MRVLIADDHRLVLDGVRRALEETDDIEVVGAAESGSQVLPLARRTNPDVVLVDMRMPQVDGLTCIDHLREHLPGVKVIVLSAYADSGHIEAAFKRGASGYIVKSVNPVDLPSAIRQSLDGTFFSPLAGGDESAGDAATAAGLTDREREILEALARGLSNQAIGKEFWVTEQTVKFHLTNIYRKLGVANRTEAARYAYHHGIIENPLYQHG